MDGFTKRVYTPLDKSLVTKNCPQGASLNTRKCSHNWPRFPCYNKKTGSCESTDGVQNVDPLDDILYAIGESYVALSNLTKKVLHATPPERQLESEEKLIRFFREYGTTLSPISSSGVKLLDSVRYYDADGYVDMAGDKIKGKIKQYQTGGNKFTKIVNPKTGKKISINTLEGKRILEKYAKLIN